MTNADSSSSSSRRTHCSTWVSDASFREKELFDVKIVRTYKNPRIEFMELADRNTFIGEHTELY